MDEQQVFENRLTQVRQAMRDKGLQTLLVHDAGRHNFLRMNYVAYLTDFISVGPETMLVVPLEDAPMLYLAPAWDIAARARRVVGWQMFGHSKNSGRVGRIMPARSGSSAVRRCMSGCMTRSSKRWVKRRSTPKTSSRTWRAAKAPLSWSACGARRRSPMPASAPCTKMRGPA